MGFSGNIPNRYNSSVSDAHGWAMRKFREIVATSQSDNPPTIRERSVIDIMRNNSMSGGATVLLGIGSPANVVVNRNEYAFVAQRLYQEDEKMGICIYNTCAEIEAMCETIYQLPETVPHCKQMIAKVLESLAEYRELSDLIVNTLRNYSRDILND